MSAWLYWDERRREQELLRRARSYGLSLAELGRFLGIGTRQGMNDYLDRLAALLTENPTRSPHHDGADGHRSAQQRDPRREPPPGVATSFVGRTRRDRDADVHATRRDRARTRSRPDRDDWILRHRDRVAQIVSSLLEQTARLGLDPGQSDVGEQATLGDYLAWLGEDLDDGAEPATITALGLALGELRAHPQVNALARNHTLHQVIRAADQLRADYADLAPRLASPS